MHDGRRLVLTDSDLETVRRVGVDAELTHGMRYGYLLPSGHRMTQYQAALREAVALVTHPAAAGRWIQRPPRDALVTMRTLQALDGAHAGASQRAIASVIFGDSLVARGWAPDGDLRAQLRHLLRRGRELRDGGYRRLLKGTASPDSAEL